jgi:hypothetical protein
VADKPTASQPAGSKGVPSRDEVDRMARGIAAGRTGWDGKPLDDRTRRMYALRESGYKGPIDRDGYAVADLSAPVAERSTGSRVVDRDGFVVGSEGAPGGAGSRPSVGGLSARVERDGQVYVIVGLDSTGDGGLALDLVPVPGNSTSLAASNRAMAAYKRGEVEAEHVPAEGLTALDA